jgi:hypothetical protein
MKVYLAIFLGLVAMFIVSIFHGSFEFLLILTLSLLPLLTLHGKKELKVVHGDEKIYSGFKVLYHPLVIFFVLTLTHQLWLK